MVDENEDHAKGRKRSAVIMWICFAVNVMILLSAYYFCWQKLGIQQATETIIIILLLGVGIEALRRAGAWLFRRPRPSPADPQLPQGAPPATPRPGRRIPASPVRYAVAGLMHRLLVTLIFTQLAMLTAQSHRATLAFVGLGLAADLVRNLRLPERLPIPTLRRLLLVEGEEGAAIRRRVGLRAFPWVFVVIGALVAWLVLVSAARGVLGPEAIAALAPSLGSQPAALLLEMSNPLLNAIANLLDRGHAADAHAALVLYGGAFILTLIALALACRYHDVRGNDVTTYRHLCLESERDPKRLHTRYRVIFLVNLLIPMDFFMYFTFVYSQGSHSVIRNIFFFEIIFFIFWQVPNILFVFALDWCLFLMRLQRHPAQEERLHSTPHAEYPSKSSA